MKERIYTARELKEFLDKLPDNTPIYSYDFDFIWDEDCNIVDIQDEEVFSIECEISPSGRLYMGCYKDMGE